MSKIEELELFPLCGACPEDYDVKLHGTQVGYMRLRHGIFRVECPDVGGEEVFRAQPEGDGIFADHEREGYLNQGKTAIIRWLEKKEYVEAVAQGNCHFCAGRRGGVPGNENIVHGMVVCDDCHADIIKIERAIRGETLSAAAMIARLTKGGFSANLRYGDTPEEPELLRDEDGPWVLNGDIAKRIESVQFTADGRWQSPEAMKLWGEATKRDGEWLHEIYDGNGRPKVIR